jgi:hypothetical protein
LAGFGLQQSNLSISIDSHLSHAGASSVVLQPVSMYDGYRSGGLVDEILNVVPTALPDRQPCFNYGLASLTTDALPDEPDEPCERNLPFLA